MFSIIKYLVVATAIVLGAAYFMPWIEVADWKVWLQVVVVLYLANIFIAKFLKFIFAPLNFISFGLVGLAINVLMIHLTSMYIDWFAIDGTVPLLVFAIVLSLSGYLFDTKIL